jgi:hypothetical protein
VLEHEEDAMSSSVDRYELLALRLAEGHSQIVACKLAGFSDSSRGSASRICNRESVRARVEALLGEVEKRVLTKVTWDRIAILKALQGNAIKARAQGEYAPSNRAIELLGRDQGMFGAQPRTLEALEVCNVENEAELAASWLEEMEEKLQITTLKELAAALRKPTASPGI